MKTLAAFLLAAALCPPAAAQTTDAAALQLQATESALRAHANQSHPTIIRKSAAASAGMPLDRAQAPREFPLPQRIEIEPNSAHVQGLVAASTAKSAAATAKAKPPTADDAATQEGLAAIGDFRRNHGLTR